MPACSCRRGRGVTRHLEIMEAQIGARWPFPPMAESAWRRFYMMLDLMKIGSARRFTPQPIGGAHGSKLLRRTNFGLPLLRPQMAISWWPVPLAPEFMFRRTQAPHGC